MTTPDETKLMPCPCGKPTGVLSRRTGETLHHQVCCSDASCPLINTYATAGEATKVWNNLMCKYTPTPNSEAVEMLAYMMKCFDTYNHVPRAHWTHTDSNKVMHLLSGDGKKGGGG